jgi:hypothetical protein
MNIKIGCRAHLPEPKMYGPFEILDIISLKDGCLRLPKTWKLYPVFYVSLIKPYIQGNLDDDLNAIPTPSDSIENTAKYDVDQVMGVNRNRWEGCIPSSMGGIAAT